MTIALFLIVYIGHLKNCVIGYIKGSEGTFWEFYWYRLTSVQMMVSNCV